MMFLQYAIWGSWTTALAVQLVKLGFDGQQIGMIYGCMWLACMIAPFIGGQLVDRFMPTQMFLALAHITGAALLYLTAMQSEFSMMWKWMFVYCLFYAPTLALTNSICFRNLKDAEGEFGRIRMWGTVGWITVGWLVTFMRHTWHTESWQGGIDLLAFASACSLLMGIYCFFLPHTPPIKRAAEPLAFLSALSLLKDKNFFIFMLVSFIVTTELQFYYVPTAQFLNDMGTPETWLTGVKTTAQIAEVFVLLFLLHISIRKLGLRRTMAIGIIAWPVRYFLFCIPNLGVIIASLSLHGFGFAFFFVASQIFVNMKASQILI